MYSAASLHPAASLSSASTVGLHCHPMVKRCYWNQTEELWGYAAFYKHAVRLYGHRLCENTCLNVTLCHNVCMQSVANVGKLVFSKNKFSGLQNVTLIYYLFTCFLAFISRFMKMTLLPASKLIYAPVHIFLGLTFHFL